MNIVNKLIKHFENNRSNYISGPELANIFNVTRNTIWKTINKLERMGYKFIRSSKGYKLDNSCDVLSKEVILSNVNKNITINPFIILDTIDSTNTYSKALKINEDSYCVVISNNQTNGRGRLGREFYSPKNSGIYMSFSFKCNSHMINPISVTSIASVAVAKAVEKLTNINVGIKWVNDLFIDNKKFCGILTEATSNLETGYIDNIIIGIGINVSTNNFPDELKSIATSLNISNMTRNRLISEIINNFDYYITNFNNNDYLDYYKSHSIVIGKDVNYFINNVKYFGKVIDINDKGELIVLDSSNKEIILRTGEITLRINKEWLIIPYFF